MANVYSADFERFWAAFPRGRKTKKLLAWKAWLKAIKLADPEDIIDMATVYAESPIGRSKYVSGPAPWLNGGRWDDDPESWQRGDDKETRNFSGVRDWLNG